MFVSGWRVWTLGPGTGSGPFPLLFIPLASNTGPCPKGRTPGHPGGTERVSPESSGPRALLGCSVCHCFLETRVCVLLGRAAHHTHAHTGTHRCTHRIPASPGHTCAQDPQKCPLGWFPGMASGPPSTQGSAAAWSPLGPFSAESLHLGRALNGTLIF